MDKHEKFLSYKDQPIISIENILFIKQGENDDECYDHDIDYFEPGLAVDVDNVDGLVFEIRFTFKQNMEDYVTWRFNRSRTRDIIYNHLKTLLYTKDIVEENIEGLDILNTQELFERNDEEQTRQAFD